MTDATKELITNLVTWAGQTSSCRHPASLPSAPGSGTDPVSYSWWQWSSQRSPWSKGQAGSQSENTATIMGNTSTWFDGLCHTIKLHVCDFFFQVRRNFHAVFRTQHSSLDSCQWNINRTSKNIWNTCTGLH